VSTVVYGDFEWDDAKAAANFSAHGVRFEEAADALATDPHEISVEDPSDPSRVVSLVMSSNLRVLYVVSTERGSRTRLISARKANSHEQRTYAQERS
jgi:uncharacterized protein